MRPRNGYNEAVVRAFMRSYGVPEPFFEVEFYPGRKWRWDICFPDSMLAVECNGGLWNAGAHVRPARMLKEYEKWSRATARGWRILFTTPQTLMTKETIDLIRECLGLCPVPDKHIGMAARV